MEVAGSLVLVSGKSLSFGAFALALVRVLIEPDKEGRNGFCHSCLRVAVQTGVPLTSIMPESQTVIVSLP